MTVRGMWNVAREGTGSAFQVQRSDTTFPNEVSSMVHAPGALIVQAKDYWRCHDARLAVLADHHACGALLAVQVKPHAGADAVALALIHHTACSRQHGRSYLIAHDVIGHCRHAASSCARPCPWGPPSRLACYLHKSWPLS
jgi:hypothetical protein